MNFDLRVTRDKKNKQKPLVLTTLLLSLVTRTGFSSSNPHNGGADVLYSHCTFESLTSRTQCRYNDALQYADYLQYGAVGETFADFSSICYKLLPSHIPKSTWPWQMSYTLYSVTSVQLHLLRQVLYCF